MNENKNGAGVITSQTVLKSLDVLDCLGGAAALICPGNCQIGQVSFTAYRLLTTLRGRGYVMVERLQQIIRWGLKYWPLARVVLDTMNLPKWPSLICTN